jgi:glucan biosynthesis protein C
MQERIYGLDLLRVIIMLFGPTFHAAMLIGGGFGFGDALDQNKLIHNILFVTNPFRMELFFMISGFFAALLIAKKGVAYYGHSRTKRILKPTIFAMLTVLPLTIMAIVALREFKNIDYHISYRHLWFLVTLSMISLLTMIAPMMLMNATKALAARLNKFPFVLSAAGFCLLVCSMHLLSSVVVRVIPETMNFIFQIKATVFYSAQFLIGMIIYFLTKNPGRALIAVFLVLYFIWYVAIFCNDALIPMKGFWLLIKDVFSSLACLAFFYLFYDLKIGKSRALTTLSRIALPFYLIHLPVLIVLSHVWLKVAHNGSSFTYAAVVIPLTVTLSLLASFLAGKVNFINKRLGLSQQ